MAFIGYARVSTQDQILDMQLDALKKQGCEKIYTEKVSGKASASKKRKALAECMEYMRKGDTLVIYKADRVFRSTLDLLKVLNTLREQGILFLSINEPMFSSYGENAYSTFFTTMLGALGQLERDITAQRTKDGLEAKRKRGIVGGRPKGLTDKTRAKARQVYKLRQENKLSMQEIADIVGVSRGTAYNYVELYSKEDE